MDAIRTRVSELLGVRYPIVQAPMGWIARSQLASAVSNAGGLGIIETSSGELDAVKDEIRKMRDLTDKPFGVNIAQLFVRDPGIVDFVVDQGVKFVTTSAGDPRKYTAPAQGGGAHRVPRRAVARRGAEGGRRRRRRPGGRGRRGRRLQESARRRDDGAAAAGALAASTVPIIAAGGICDGPSMAAAFALGAEGVQMGSRMVSAAESPVHDNWKQAIVAAKETDTVFLNRFSRPGLRALRTATTASASNARSTSAWTSSRARMDLYFGGDMEAAIALGGQVVGRIDAVKPVAQIIAETVAGFRATAAAMQRFAAGTA